MKREALIRELRKQARKEGLEFEVDAGHGKGSHYTIRYGAKATTIPSGELSPRFVALIKRQLGVE